MMYGVCVQLARLLKWKGQNVGVLEAEGTVPRMTRLSDPRFALSTLLHTRGQLRGVFHLEAEQGLQPKQFYGFPMH